MENKDERKTFCCSMHGDNGQPRETGRCEWCRKNMHPHLKKNPMENKDWKEQFKQEFGIHFSDSEFIFAISFIESLLKSKSEVRQRIHQAEQSLLKSKQEEIERAIGLKYKLFGAAGCSRDEEVNRINAVHIARMDGYNQAVVELKPIISNILK